MSALKASPGHVSLREQRRLQRCELILSVAARSFLENGYDGTTMSSVAAELKGSKETLWRHFASKEQLFAAFLERATQAFNDELTTIFNPSVASVHVVERVCTSFLRKILTPDMLALYRLVVGESGRYPEVGRIFHERVQIRLECMLKNVLRERLNMEEGAAELGMRFLLHLCIGNLFARALVHSEGLDAETVSRESKRISDCFFRLFEADPGPRRAQG